MKLLAILLLAIGLLSHAASARELEVSFETLLSELGELQSLSQFRMGHVRLFSSFDRKGGNQDYQNFLEDRGSEHLMARVNGPGAIVRMWSANPSGTLRIVLDGVDQPVMDFADYFRMTDEPINTVAMGGNVSYLPLPFQRSCEVYVANPPPQLYYQVNILTLPPSTRVHPLSLPLSSDQSAELNGLALSWQNAGAPAEQLHYLAPVAIESGAEVTLATLQGPQKVLALGVRTDGEPGGSLTDSLDGLTLKAFFDGHTSPDVDAPLGLLFGYGIGSAETRSLFAGRTAQGNYLLFPMPFGHSAVFKISNRLNHAVKLSFGLNAVKHPFDSNQEGYFHAQYKHEAMQPGRPHLWLNVRDARGHLVGVSQLMSGPSERLLEGDDQIRVDREVWIKSQDTQSRIGPWNGTGTEDYFNSGWYFKTGNMTFPTHGARLKLQDQKIAAFRWHILDAPSFEHSIEADMEHGEDNGGDGNPIYSSVVYWYSDGEAPPR